MFNRHRGWGAWATVCAVVAIAAGCNRGKEWCGPCEPGYGTLHVTTKFEDEYTESVAEGAGASMYFILEQSEEKFDDCQYFGDPYNLIDTRNTELEFTRTYQVPEGWVCATTGGQGGALEGERDSTETGGSYQYNLCGGGFGPTRVRECVCIEEVLDVTCELEWYEPG